MHAGIIKQWPILSLLLMCTSDASLCNEIPLGGVFHWSKYNNLGQLLLLLDMTHLDKINKPIFIQHIGETAQI